MSLHGAWSRGVAAVLGEARLFGWGGDAALEVNFSGCLVRPRVVVPGATVVSMIDSFGICWMFGSTNRFSVVKNSNKNLYCKF